MLSSYHRKAWSDRWLQDLTSNQSSRLVPLCYREISSRLGTVDVLVCLTDRNPFLFQGMNFGLRLLALDKSEKEAGLALPPPVKAVYWVFGWAWRQLSQKKMYRRREFVYKTNDIRATVTSHSRRLSIAVLQVYYCVSRIEWRWCVVTIALLWLAISSGVLFGCLLWLDEQSFKRFEEFNASFELFYLPPLPRADQLTPL
jgi:hypothetical protein